MPPGEPDRPLITVAFVVPPVALFGLVVVSLLRGDNGRAVRVAVLLLIGVPILVHAYRRDFPREDG